MRQVRRTRYLFIYLHDGRFLDIEAFHRGVIELSPARQIFAVSILQGEEHPVTMEELQLLLDIPSDRWTPVGDILAGSRPTADTLCELAHKGILLTDDPEFGELRRRDERLSSTAWNLYAVLYHFMTKWHDMHLKLRTLDDQYLAPETGAARGEALDRFIERHGKPLHPFHSIDDQLGVRELPPARRDGPLYDTLLRRRTTRAFDASTSLAVEVLSTILRYVFGCQGHFSPHRDIQLLKKTSPSGGALHPIEVYPLVKNIRGVDSGLYHYNVEHHALELIELVDAEEAAEMACVFAAGQSFVREAHVLFVLAARFQRNFWKYRKHEKAYRVLLLDAGHLSQTHYLVCTELGLGAFVTAAINDANIEERLGLDGFEEGVLAVLGCGIPAPRNAELDPVFEPYVPGEASPS